jgi:hypothetical protein
MSSRKAERSIATRFVVGEGIARVARDVGRTDQHDQPVDLLQCVADGVFVAEVKRLEASDEDAEVGFGSHDRDSLDCLCEPGLPELAITIAPLARARQALRRRALGLLLTIAAPLTRAPLHRDNPRQREDTR